MFKNSFKKYLQFNCACSRFAGYEPCLVVKQDKVTWQAPKVTSPVRFAFYIVFGTALQVVTTRIACSRMLTLSHA